jgi:hypothetical protein
MYHRLGNHFGYTRWNSYVTRLKWKLISVRSEIVLILMKISARFAPNVQQAQKLFSMYPMEHLGDDAQVDALFSLFGDSVSVSAR